MRWFLLLGLIVLGLALLAANRRRPWVEYAFFLRFPLLSALGLLLLPAVALGPLRSLLANLYALSPAGLALVTGLALLASWVVLLTSQLVLRYGPERFEGEALHDPDVVRPWRPGAMTVRRAAAFSLLAAPLAASAVGVSPAPFCEGRFELFEIESVCATSGVHPGLSLTVKTAAALTGGAAAWALLALFALLYAASLPPRAVGSERLLPDFVDGFEAHVPRFAARLRRLARGVAFSLRGLFHRVGRLVNWVLPPRSAARIAWRATWQELFVGYLRTRRGQVRLRSAHRLALFLLAMAAAVYGLGYLVTGPGAQPVPALAYLLVLWILASWALPGVAFFLDRFRLPTLVPVVIGSVLLGWAGRADHTIRLLPVPPEKVPADSQGTPSWRRSAPNQPVVVVAASGGGIAASLWTARVLTGLQQDLGPAWTRSLGFVSAVSGGSVGALFYLDRFTAAGPPGAGELEGVVRAAGFSSLDAVGWGLAYPDLWRLTLGGFGTRSELDRGWALEQAWRRHLLHPEATLGVWRQGVRAGWLPAAALNATVSETGEQLVFTSLPWSQGRSRGFHETFPGYDVPVATAARLSATFPWVTPMPRAMLPDGSLALPGWHFGDGGYFDNFGIVTALDWLRFQGPEAREEIARRGVLLVLIRAFPEVPADSQSATGGGRLYNALGPIRTLLRTHGATQAARGSNELELLTDALRQYGIRAETVIFELPTRASLSWKLTPDEKATLLEGWSSPQNRSARERLRVQFAPRGRRSDSAPVLESPTP